MTQIEKMSRALLVSLSESADGLHLNLDDVVQDSVSQNSWKEDRHVTSKAYSIETFEQLSFTDKELADIGYYVIVRLRANKKVWNNK